MIFPTKKQKATMDEVGDDARVHGLDERLGTGVLRVTLTAPSIIIMPGFPSHHPCWRVANLIASLKSRHTNSIDSQGTPDNS